MTEPNPGKRVAVIGLGNMGSALAEALLANSHEVTVWNRTAAKAEPLMAAGAAAAGSAAEAAAAADVVILCVTNHEASASLLHSDTVARALHGKLLVQLSTVTAEESRDLGGWAEAHGIAYLDGSILGYPEHIRREGCTVVYSGPRRDFEANKEVLAALGGNPQHVGESAGGAVVFDKTIYAYHYGSMLAFLHGAALCHAAGFPVETYVSEIATHGPAMKIRFGEMMAERRYDNPSCAMEVDAAAYGHVVRLSEEFGVDRDLAHTVARYFDRGIANGYGNQETAALFEVLLKQSA
jgi:3-hydroxyisobutyrate dehydrogenase-like beta-hydroxyacid dehydrogenase